MAAEQREDPRPIPAPKGPDPAQELPGDSVEHAALRVVASAVHEPSPQDPGVANSSRDVEVDRGVGAGQPRGERAEAHTVDHRARRRIVRRAPAGGWAS